MYGRLPGAANPTEIAVVDNGIEVMTRGFPEFIPFSAIKGLRLTPCDKGYLDPGRGFVTHTNLHLHTSENGDGSISTNGEHADMVALYERIKRGIE